MDLDRLTAFDPEQAVLVAVLRGATPPPVRDEVRLAAVTAWHRLEGVLAAADQRSRLGSSDLTGHLADARTHTRARWRMLRHRLVGLVGTWAAAGIPVTLLKGAALVEAGLLPADERPMADLDVLVPAETAPRAHALAQDHGDLTDTAESADWDHARRLHHQLPALVDGRGSVVEVHHRLLDVDHPLRRLDDAIRTRTTDVPSLAGADRLDDAALWCHLAVHAWDDRRRGTGGVLMQVLDLDRVLSRLEPDGVDELVELAERTGAAPLVGRVAAVLDAVVPSPAAARLRRSTGGPPVDDALVERFVFHRILGRRSPLAQLVHPTGNVRHTPWRMATRLRRQLAPPSQAQHGAREARGHAWRHVRGLLPVVGDGLLHLPTTLLDVELDRWAQVGTMDPRRRSP